MDPFVLVVDDDPNAAATVSAALGTEACRVECVDTCAAASARMARELPAVLVVDVDVPGGGWSLIADLRADERARAIPVVVSSAGARPGDPAAPGLGVRWMTKPFHLSQARRLLAPLVRAARERAVEAGTGGARSMAAGRASSGESVHEGIS
jgi:two-component system response regulator HydG